MQQYLVLIPAIQRGTRLPAVALAKAGNSKLGTLPPACRSINKLKQLETRNSEHYRHLP